MDNTFWCTNIKPLPKLRNAHLNFFLNMKSSCLKIKFWDLKEISENKPQVLFVWLFKVSTFSVLLLGFQMSHDFFLTHPPAYSHLVPPPQAGSKVHTTVRCQADIHLRGTRGTWWADTFTLVASMPQWTVMLLHTCREATDREQSRVCLGPLSCI